MTSHFIILTRIQYASASHGNALPAGRVHNSLSDSYKMLCRLAWIRRCVLFS